MKLLDDIQKEYRKSKVFFLSIHNFKYSDFVCNTV